MAPDIICPAQNHLNSQAPQEGSLKGKRIEETYKATEATEATEERYFSFLSALCGLCGEYFFSVVNISSSRLSRRLISA